MRGRAKRAGAWWPYSPSERMELLGDGGSMSVNGRMNPVKPRSPHLLVVSIKCVTLEKQPLAVPQATHCM